MRDLHLSPVLETLGISESEGKWELVQETGAGLGGRMERV